MTVVIGALYLKFSVNMYALLSDSEDKKEPVVEESKDDVKADIEETEGEDQGPESEESELVRKLRQELQDKEEEYTGKIQELQGKAK